MKTLLYDIHENLGARFTDFAGYKLPLYYTSITSEHLTVRHKVGLFDVSHMGRIIISGKDAKEFLNFLTANDVNKLYPGKMHYSLILNEGGGILDDVTVFMIDEEHFLVVVNASNRLKVISWFNQHKKNYDVRIEDITKTTVMFAVQGPRAKELYENYFGKDFSLKRFHFEEVTFNDAQGKAFLSRSGYTGEDGFEIVFNYYSKKDAFKLWRDILKKTYEFGGLPCGLGARDMLRLEAGYCLYGNDIDESVNPFEANLGWVVKMDKGVFIGKEALQKLKKSIKKLRMGLVMIDPGIPRRGYRLFKYSLSEGCGEETTGYVTSGGFSPILEKGMAMVYVALENETPSTLQDMKVCVDIRGRKRLAHIKDFPLFDPKKYGYKREVSIN